VATTTIASKVTKLAALPFGAYADDSQATVAVVVAAMVASSSSTAMAAKAVPAATTKEAAAVAVAPTGSRTRTSNRAAAKAGSFP
jgi:hypothetical protein